MPYPLSNISAHYGKEVARSLFKRTKNLQIQTKWDVLDSFGPQYIFSFFLELRWKYDKNAVFKRATLWWLLKFINHKLTKRSPLTLSWSLNCRSVERKEQVLSTGSQLAICWRHMPSKMNFPTCDPTWSPLFNFQIWFPLNMLLHHEIRRYNGPVYIMVV